MSQLKQFADRVEAQIAVAGSPIPSRSADMKPNLRKVDQRATRFHEIASQLLYDIIHPRMAKLASYFENAEVKHSDDDFHCVCSFSYRPRFPATAKMDIGIKHDKRVETVLISHELAPTPIFPDYDSRDTLQFPLYAVDRDRIGSWVEHKIICFVSTYLQYLRLERASHSPRHSPVTDPVCGMRFGKSSAAAGEDYCGHRYYFCSKECQAKFSDAPGQFIWFRSIRSRLCRQDTEHGPTNGFYAVTE